jgi:hypothetical protein
MVRCSLLCGALALVACLASPLRATLITINFDDVTDSFLIGNHYAPLGATFTGALALSAGISLNDAEFPPHSGTNVVIDANGPITIQFSSPVDSFSAFFTYVTSVLVTAYDAGSVPVRTATSLFSQNFVSSGNPPNEAIGVTYAPGIDHVTIVGDPAGGSFAMDDVSFDVITATSGVPEPGSIFLVGVALSALTAVSRRLRRNSRD